MTSPRLDRYQQSLGQLPGVVRPSKPPPLQLAAPEIGRGWLATASIALMLLGLSLLNFAMRGCQ